MYIHGKYLMNAGRRKYGEKGELRILSEGVKQYFDRVSFFSSPETFFPFS